MHNLFFRVMNNVYLRSIIRYHRIIYNRVFFKHMHHTIDELSNFVHRTYITTLELVKDKSLFPTVTIGPKTSSTDRLPGYIPQNVISLRFKRNVLLVEGDIPPCANFINFGDQFSTPLDLSEFHQQLKLFNFQNIHQ